MKNKSKILFLLTICTSFLFLTACKEEEKNAAPQQMPPPLVTIYTVKSGDHPLHMNFQAVTQGSKAVEVRARVQALIKERMYVEGEFVKEGQILFQLEPNEYEARMGEAQAQYQQASREWNRIGPLYARNAVSQKERDSALAAFESAKANLRIAQINLDYCQVTAPVAGYSGKEVVTAGNLVNNGTLMTSINQTDPLFVNFSFPGTTYLRNQQLSEEGRLDLPEGNVYSAKIRLIDGTMYPLTGKVTFVDSQVDQSTGVVKARAEFENKDDAVFPGQYVRIFLEGAMLKNVVLVPQRAVLNTQMGSVVMLVNDKDIVEMRPVKVNMNVEQMYLLDEGLKDGDRIVLDGLVKARPGSPVTIDTGEKPNGAGAGAAAGGEKPAQAQQNDAAKTSDTGTTSDAPTKTDEAAKANDAQAQPQN